MPVKVGGRGGVGARSWTHGCLPGSRANAEFDDGRKFWWTDWRRMIGDAVTAVLTGEPVLYDDG